MPTHLPERDAEHDDGVGWLREESMSYALAMVIATVGLALNASALAIVLVLTLIMR